MIRDQRRLAAIVSADVVGYSLLMGRDESVTLAALRAHRNEMIDPKIAEYGGRIVKTMGDGLLLEFRSVVDAVRCAVDVQRGMAERNAVVPQDRRIDFRIGINLGDIIIDGDDIFGDGVNVAARLQALADRGGICVSKVVRDQVLNKLNFTFEDLGAQRVKNIALPVEVYRVDLESGALPTPSSATKRRMPRAITWRRFGAGIVAFGFAAAAVWTLLHLWKTPTSSAPPMSVAVLLFTVSADSVGDKQFAEALTRDLAVGLGRSRRVQVVSHAAVAADRGDNIDTQHVGQQLNVRYLIEGHVRRAGQTTVIDAELIDAAKASQSWAGRFEVEDTAAAQNGGVFLGQLTRRLEDALWAAETARARIPPAADATAMDLALAARKVNQMYAGDPLKGALEARKLYDQALRRDPNLGAALVGKAGTFAFEIYFNPSVDHDRAVREFDELTFRAVTLDDQDPDAWEARGVALGLQWRWDAALEANSIARKLDPTRNWALTERAELMFFMGQPDAALTLVDQALALEPSGVVAISWPLDVRCRASMALGRYAEAVEACEKSVGEYDWWMPHLYLVAAYTHLGKTAMAETEKAKLLQQRSGISIADFKSLRLSNAQAFLQQTEMHLYAGLRKAGVPEQ